MNEIFTLRTSSMSIKGRVDDFGLGVHNIDGVKMLQMACKIVRRNEQGQWLKQDHGEMMFHDSRGNIHEGYYKDTWWSTRIPLKEAMEGVEYWPYELNEGSMQYIHTCEVKRMSVAFPERKVEETLDEIYNKGVVKGATILGQNEEVLIPTFIEIEATDQSSLDLNKEMQDIIDSEDEAPVTSPPKAIKTWSLTEEGEELVEKIKGIVNEEELPPPPKEVFQCPICGITTTKSGTPFKSWNSVKTHSLASHEVRLINEKDRIEVR